MERGDQITVWVNQGDREGKCLAVIGEQALIKYAMPAGREFMVIVDKDVALLAGNGLWRPVAPKAIPKKWQAAIDEAKREDDRLAQSAAWLDQKVRDNTAFKSMQEMVMAGGDYRPSMDTRVPVMLEIADAYDRVQERRGDARRAFRYGGPR